MPASLSEAFRTHNSDTSSYTRSSIESLKNPQFDALDQTMDMTTSHNMSLYNALTPIGPMQLDRRKVSEPNASHIGGSYQGYNSMIVEENMAKPYGPKYIYGGSYNNINNGNNGNNANNANTNNGNYNNGNGENQQNHAQPVADTVSLISSVNSDQFNDEVEQIRRKYNLDSGMSKSNDQTCDMNIYHILSCSKCRKRLKKLFRDDDVKEDELEFLDRPNKSNKLNRKKCNKVISNKAVCNKGDDDNDDDGDDDADDDDDGGDNYDNNNNKNKKRNHGFDFNVLFKGQSHSMMLLIISGIFIILLLDFFLKFVRLQ